MIDQTKNQLNLHQSFVKTLTMKMTWNTGLLMVTVTSLRGGRNRIPIYKAKIEVKDQFTLTTLHEI